MERGAGETAASGTCAAGAVVLSAFMLKTGRDVNVHSPGGVTRIRWRDDDEMVITGRARSGVLRPLADHAVALLAIIATPLTTNNYPCFGRQASDIADFHDKIRSNRQPSRTAQKFWAPLFNSFSTKLIRRASISIKKTPSSETRFRYEKNRFLLHFIFVRYRWRLHDRRSCFCG